MRKLSIPALVVVFSAMAVAGSLLIQAGKVTISPTNTPFIAKDHFVPNAEQAGAVKISYLG